MPVQKQTHRTAHKHVEHQYATYIQNKTIFVFFGFFHFCFYWWFMIIRTFYLKHMSDELVCCT